jgi:hypothetical protein
MRGLLISILAFGACTTADKVALEEYAPSSPEADIEEVSLSAADNDTFDPERVGTEFPDSTKQVAVWYKWDDADSGKKVGIRWSKNGEVVLEQGETLSKIAGASAYVLKMAAGSKLPIGDYQVELLEDGVSVTKIPFKVGDPGASEVATEPDATANPAADAGEETEVGSAEEVPVVPEPAGEQPLEELPTEGQPATEEAPPEVAALAASGTAPVVAVAGRRLGSLAAQETEWPGVVVELTEFTRKGQALNAKLRFTNKGDKKARPDFYYRDTYALDENNKKYEVMKDEKGGYLGSVASGYNYWWAEDIEPGASRTVWMRFQAPPTNVRTMTIQVGTLDPFEDVQLR